MADKMTLIDRLRNPQWINDPNRPPMLDVEQTVKAMTEAADLLAALTSEHRGEG